MRYKCMLEIFIEVEANNDEEAQIKAAEELKIIDIEQIIVWPID